VTAAGSDAAVKERRRGVRGGAEAPVDERRRVPAGGHQWDGDRSREEAGKAVIWYPCTYIIK
jgi:hypothetical protein